MEIVVVVIAVVAAFLAYRFVTGVIKFVLIAAVFVAALYFGGFLG